MWWTLFPFLVAGSVMLVRRREYSQLTATAGFVVVIVIFLAFTGQFIRHHYMLEPVGLCLAAVGLTALSEHRRARHARYPMAVIGASLLMFAAAVTSVIQSLVVR
jgi:prepilin signal peptidase PulO-like enzyme (type II secretory pathway)